MSKAETVTSRIQRGFVAMTFLAAYTLSAFAPFINSSVAFATEQPVHKSYVCKYVGTPGVDERLQTGQNPIFVDNHALSGKDEEISVGDEFSDAQGRSVVIVANTVKLDPEPGIGQCPAPDGPDEVPIPTPGVNDPCGPRNAAWIVPQNTSTVTWVLNNGNLTASTTEGYVFTDGKTTHNYGHAPDSGDDCVLPPPQMPTKYDPCETSNDTYTIPNVEGVTYKVNNQVVNSGTHPTGGALTVTVTAHAAEGSGYTMHNSWTLTFTDVDCGETAVIKQKPGQLCVPGPNNDTISYPIIAHVTYSQTGWADNENTVTATADEGYYFQGTEGATQVQWVLFDANTNCGGGGGGGGSTPVVLSEPSVVVVCGPNNDTVTLPVVAYITYAQTGWINGQNTVTATTHDGYYFQGTEGDTEMTWVLTDTNTPCGEVLGETTPPPTPSAPILPVGGQGAVLQDTGNDMLLPMFLSTGILGLAIMTMLQNSPSRRRPSRLAAFFQRRAYELQTAFAQPFSTV